MSKKEGLYIEMLKYAEQNQKEGFIISDLKEFIKTKNLYPASDRIFNEASRDLFKVDTIGTTTRAFLSVESSFKLLEHTELSEARESSKQAMVIAIFDSYYRCFSFLANSSTY